MVFMGAQAVRGCAACGHKNREQARYCGECGARLGAVVSGGLPEIGRPLPAEPADQGGPRRPGKATAGIAVGGAALLGILALILWQARPHDEPERRAVESAFAIPAKPVATEATPREPGTPEDPAPVPEVRACMRDGEYARSYAEGEREFNARRFLGALRAFKGALGECADGEAKAAILAAEGKLYQDYMSDGARYEEAGEPAKAVAAYLNALQYQPGDRTAAEAVGRARAAAARAGPRSPSAGGRGRAGIEWVTISGGEFKMGSGSGDGDERPVHRVRVGTFEMAKTEVTFAQYRECVEAGACTSAHVSDGTCYLGVKTGGVEQGKLPASLQRDNQPVVCIDWEQARSFSEWIGGRLPSEAEWEYAARSAGKDWKYPWGDAVATCKLAVMYGGGPNWGCGRDISWPVCSKTAGNTAQGLCDMAGNVWEWTQDWYHGSYDGAPSDGSAWESPAGSFRVFRGVSWFVVAGLLRAAIRGIGVPGLRYRLLGLRPVRSGR